MILGSEVGKEGSAGDRATMALSLWVKSLEVKNKMFLGVGNKLMSSIHSLESL